MAATDYGDRKGFQADFLAPGKRGNRVFLPELGKALEKLATRLIADPSSYVLPYHGYNVVMQRVRRFAIYSAANVDFSGRFDMVRPKDRWLFDPRIPQAQQVGEAMYAGNQFDRGHLTRREDMEYGTARPVALVRAADTCHWTNCTPQHARFNESKQLWRGIERHLLEGAIQPVQFRAQVITGPVLAKDDRVLDGLPASPYPLRYWKIAAAVNDSGRLFATAYILDQCGVVDQFGVRGAPAVPFTPYKTFQTTIATIEKLTGLTFTGSRATGRVSLSEFDPLAKRPKPRGAGAAVSTVELQSLADIVTE